MPVAGLVIRTRYLTLLVEGVGAHVIDLAFLDPQGLPLPYDGVGVRLDDWEALADEAARVEALGG